MRVLIAEDDPVSMEALQTLLKQQGYDVTCARDGQEAWNALQKEIYPLVILDWMMPHLDGIEVCRRIRAELKTPYRCVIMLTAKQERADRTLALSVGTDVFLTKPLNCADLIARMQVAQRILLMEEQAVEEQAVS